MPRASPHQTYQTYDTIGTTQATSWAPEVATAETGSGQYHPCADSGIEAAHAAIVTHAAMVTHDRGNPADVVRPPTPTFVAADQHPLNAIRSDQLAHIQVTSSKEELNLFLKIS